MVGNSYILSGDLINKRETVELFIKFINIILLLSTHLITHKFENIHSHNFISHLSITQTE